MDDLHTLGAKCLEKIYAYHYDIDRGVATAGIVHFAPDAVFEAHGKRYEGHKGVLGFLQYREAQADRHTAHMIIGPRFSRETDGSIVIGALILISVRNSEGTYTVDRVLDTIHRFVETGGEWLIAARRSKPLHA
jgi:hypothetical protein